MKTIPVDVSTPSTATIEGINIDIDASYTAVEVCSDESMIIAYNLTGYTADGYVSVDLPVYVEFTIVSSSGDDTYYATGTSECYGSYINAVSGGGFVSVDVRIDFEAYIYPDGHIDLYVYQTIVDFNDPTGWFNPSCSFDTAFGATVYR